MSITSHRHATSVTTSSVTLSGSPTRITPSQQSTAPQRRTTVLLAGLVGCLAVATVVGAVAWNRPHTATQATVSQDLSGYAPGSSVYSEQVPTAPFDWTTSYGPSGSTYREQVPSAALPWSTSFGPGSTTYAEQVPVSGASWTSAYANGGSVFSQQVPSAAR